MDGPTKGLADTGPRINQVMDFVHIGISPGVRAMFMLPLVSPAATLTSEKRNFQIPRIQLADEIEFL